MVAGAIHVFGVAGSSYHLASGCIHIHTRGSWFHGLHGRFDGRLNGIKAALHGLRCTALARFQDVHDALDIGAVILFDRSKVEMHYVARLHLEISGGGVAHRALWAGVYRWAMQGFPGRLQAALLELGVHEGGDLAFGFADLHKIESLRIDLFSSANGLL